MIDSQSLFALLGVVVGFLLATGWDAWKQFRADKKEKQRVREILSQEIDYNVKCLEEIYNRVQAEQIKHKETSQPDKEGGRTGGGNPIQAMAKFYPNTLSHKVWDSQIHLLPSTLSAQEAESGFSFYSNLNGVIAAQEAFQRSLKSGSDPTFYFVVLQERLKEVMQYIESALHNYPKLSTSSMRKS